jgi:hypothetical protein
MLIKIAPLGERVVEVNVEEGSTVAAALQIAGVQVNGRSIRIGDSEVSENDTIDAGTTIITLVSKMKGGR